ncbi:Oligoendopeptidase F, plasmid [Metamycoplasma cloacale]|uniref:Oligopeptidase F n=1 Tax=Metamycoplasma cloacale TaxID=92401 RepID=A0A2Z4LNQ3_9BACT|nr:oligoendopeptidase F [Metamycoplasma cloacale]AWX42887.1 oligoendopeptidase F [Metamycoplasma cloacale]VEU79289.1 Oligoendopeptidase F, plasmid [Metamycoplasma cloacale]
MKKYNKYEDIEQQYRFDLKDILQGKTLDDWKHEFFAIYERLIEIKDQKYEDFNLYLEYIKLLGDSMIISNKITNYLSNKQNINVTDSSISSLSVEFENQLNEYQTRLGSEINRIAKHRKTIEKWMNLPELKEVRKDLEKTLNELDHKLSDEVENYLTETSIGEPNLEEIFVVLTDSEIDFGYGIDSKGKKHKITEGNYYMLLKNKDEKLRKTTYTSYNKAFWDKKETLSKLLYQHIKRISVNAKQRRYTSALQSILSEDCVDEKLLHLIFNSVKNNIGIFRKFALYKKKFFTKKFNKKMRPWDWNLDLVDVKTKYSIEEANEILLNITKVMPFEYHEVVKKAINENWIDYCNAPSKMSGAYSIGESHGIDKKYILMNFDGTLGSVNTLCHEMGHSMHSYYSCKTQSIYRSEYPIILAEIASIFNELLLTDYLVKNAKSDKEKFNIIERSIFDFIGTVIKQTEWANYEYYLYSKIDQQLPINSYDQLEEIYVNNSKEYSLNPKETKKGLKSNAYAVRVPHYYYYFYVYKYALGYIVANIFYNQYIKNGKEALENYITKFLSSGDINWPAEILKDAGIDIYSEDIYQQAFKNIEEKINEYIKLGKKLFK